MSLAALFVAASVTVASPAFADDQHVAESTPEYSEELQGYVPGANRLEGRIRAPCCWNQTLDIHGSEISNSLRREIRRRLRAGETPDAIEASIVQRYGEKVLAVPPNSPLKGVAIGLSVVMGAALFFAGSLLLRWRKRSRAEPKPDTKPHEPDRWDAQLDDELARLDER
jgi:cytochrome c-type biogenesis protein CcmH